METNERILQANGEERNEERTSYEKLRETTIGALLKLRTSWTGALASTLWRCRPSSFGRSRAMPYDTTAGV
jgi:hypothetical protein